jgi:hypothetical protein
MNPGGFIPKVGGILLLIAAFKDWDWLHKYQPFEKSLGRDGIRCIWIIGGLFLIGAGIFLLVVS